MRSICYLSLLPLLASADMVDTGADLSAVPRVPEGYEVTLYAKEPLVQQPSSMAFDSRGRLYVGMGPQYRNPSPETPGDSVMLVLDEDRDGVAERVQPFAKGLNSVQGLAWRGDELWIANAPDLTVVRDLNGDDVADEYVKLYTDLGNIEHALHGLVWAPDGLLYMSKGNSKGLNDPKQHQRLAPQAFRELFGQAAAPGAPAFPAPQKFTAETYQHTYQDPKDDWGLMGGILRCDRKGQGLEIVARGMRNPWDMAHDDSFHWLCTDNDQNEGDRVIMPFYGAHYGWNHPWSSSWTGGNHLPTVPLSHEVFEGSGTGMVFGSLGEQRSVFFINDWLRKTTFIFAPRWEGALMRSEWQPFITAGKALFRPTDIAFGPEGAIWCLSWSRGYGAEHDEQGKMTSEGRIYRITSKSVPQKIGISDFDSPLPVRRIDAQDRLVAEGKVDELKTQLASGGLSTAAETWTMGALGRMQVDAAWLEEQLARGGNLRQQAIRLLGEQKKISPLLPLTAHDEPRVRFHAVQALWRSGSASAVPTLLQRAAQEQERLTYYSVWRALRDLCSTSQLKEYLKHEQGGVRRAALLALLEDAALSRDEVAVLEKDADKPTRELAKSWQRLMSGEGPKQKTKDRGVDTADLAPLSGEPPQLQQPSSATTVEAVLAAIPQADVERGRLLVLHPAGASCIACHHVSGRGNRYGPELTGIGSRAELRHIIESILRPSAVITEGFNMQVIHTKGGAQSGVLLEESGLAITLGLPSGQRSRILRAEVVKQETLPVSAMPPFSSVLGAQACADIAAWLMSQKEGVVPEQKKKKKKDKKESEQVTGVPTGEVKQRYGDATSFSLAQYEKKLVLSFQGKELGTYVMEHPQVQRPFWANLRNSRGTALTRSFPPGKDEPSDHADMHPGLWLGFGGINDTDFWRNEGRVVVKKLTASEAGVIVQNDWLSKQGGLVCTEQCSMKWQQKGDSVLLHWESLISSEPHDLEFEGQEEAGLGVRVASALAVKDGQGHISASTDGQDEKALWGKSAEWWEYGTPQATLRITPSANQARTFWAHARDYGALVINPTGLPDTKGKPQSFTVKKGEVLRLAWDIELK